MAKDQDNFEALFNEGVALQEGEVTEDMAAGLDLEEALEEQTEGAEMAAAEPQADTEAGMEAEMAAGEATEGMDPPEAAAEEMAEGADESVPANEAAELEKERQRLKSWEGRLKAYDAQLKAREQAGDAAPAAAESPEVQAATAAMETQPIDEVMATLAEDFGDEFVSALTQVIEARAAEIASKVADEKVGTVAGNMDQLIASLTDEKARTHFETIADAHPDFMEVAQSDAFKQWVDSLGDKAEQAKAVIESGSARQVVKLLSEFKAAGQAGQDAMEDDAAMLAAQSVKGRGGMRLPEKPQVADDYEAAWNSFS